MTTAGGRTARSASRPARVALVAVQVEIGPEVLASAEAYRAHLVDMTRCAVEDAGEADARFVVLPELAGHLALLALAPAAARRQRTLGAALGQAAVRRPLEMLRGIASTRTLHPRHAVLAALAPDGERYWRGVFGPLARELDAYIVAGSHLRLSPAGDLLNASLLFGPDGRVLATTDKINLVPGMEDGAPGGLGLARGGPVPITATPLGEVATLICYDGFATPHTTLERFAPEVARLAARGGVAIVANPAANPWPWEGPWPPPRLAAPAHTHPTRAVQWHREGLAATPGCARFGITAHLVGTVLDLAFEGVSEILERGAPIARAPHAGRGGHAVATVAI